MERTAIEGTVTLDDAPLRYGFINFDGKPNEQGESAKSGVAVVEGKFEAKPAGGPAPGENTVRITVHEGAPPPPSEDGEEPEAVIVGYWNGPATVVSGQPLALSIKSTELVDDEDRPVRGRRTSK